ncbi:MAG: hypothetical protein DI535_00530 [Citrobacter freundii]|nr:MAG: hypothetical protein DI535_00530 [Citrobacter freundii]
MTGVGAPLNLPLQADRYPHFVSIGFSVEAVQIPADHADLIRLIIEKIALMVTIPRQQARITRIRLCYRKFICVICDNKPQDLPNAAYFQLST